MATITRRSKTKVSVSPVSVLSVAAVCLIAFARPAYAYVDPSVVTYTIQALAAVAVALSAVAGVAFRRSRRVIFKLLGIDENAGTIAEPEVSAIDPSEKAVADAAALEAFEAASRPVEEKPLTWGVRFLWAFLASAFLCLTLFVVAPVEIVASSASSLTFGLADVLPIILCAALAATLLIALVASLVRGRAFRVVIAVICAVGVCAWLQAFAFNKGLPIADGKAVPWEDYTKITLVTGLVWVLIIAGFVTLAVRFSRVFRVVAMALCAALAIVQIVGAASLIVDPKGESILDNPETILVTNEGLYTVSSKDNVIVFILDTMEVKVIQAMLEKYPDLFSDFTGFTFYSDSSGRMIPTHNAIPALLSGSDLSDYGEYFTWFGNMYQDSTFMDDMLAAGYDLGIYSNESIWSNKSGRYMADRTINIRPAGEGEELKPDVVGTIRILWRCALYRDITWLLKPYFWFYTDQINNSMIADDAASFNEHTPYSYDDARWYRNLQNVGLSTVEGGENGSFRFIHLLGSHYPYLIEPDGTESTSGNTNEWQQNFGVIRMVGEYLNQLKELGLYDGATIIVTADHGEWHYTAEHLTITSCPIMIVKPGHQTAEEASAPLVICDDVPVSHDDFPATVLDAMGASDDVVDRNGTSIFDLDDSPRIRYYITSRWYSYDNHQEVFDEYEIDGYAPDIENWEYTGNSWWGLG